MSANQRLRDQMYALVEKWKAEGGVQKSFCSKHGISVLKFQYWHKRYKEEQFSLADNQSPFIKMAFPPAQNYELSGGRVEVIYPNGIRVLLDQAVTAHFLKGLL